MKGKEVLRRKTELKTSLTKLNVSTGAVLPLRLEPGEVGGCLGNTSGFPLQGGLAQQYSNLAPV